MCAMHSSHPPFQLPCHVYPVVWSLRTFLCCLNGLSHLPRGLCIHSVTMQILHEIAFFNWSSLDNPGLYWVNKTKQPTPSLFGLQGALGGWWEGRFAKAVEEPRKRAGVHGVTGPEVWQKDYGGIRLRGFFVGNYQTSHLHPKPLVESKDFWVVRQSARTDSQSALARNKNGCLFAQLPSSCGKLTRKAGGFLSSLPALKFDSCLIFLASPAKAHWDRRQQAATRQADRQMEQQRGRADPNCSVLSKPHS